MTQAWHVVEGAESNVTGAWSVNEDNQGNITGSAHMNAPQGIITYKLRGYRDNPDYNISRVTPSNGINVTYTGRLDGNGNITGQGLNNAGAPVPWSAHIA